MTQSNDSAQPALSALLAGFLEKQAGLQGTGLAVPDSDEVVPYEAAPVQPVEPRIAWEEALEAGQHFQAGFHGNAAKVPPDWASLVSSSPPVAALAFCFGNYPQLARDLHALMKAKDLSELRPTKGRAISLAGMSAGDAITGLRGPEALLTAGVLRLAGRFEEAAKVLQTCEAQIPPSWQAAWANESAALAWHRGDAEEAAAMWAAQTDHAPVLFNRGMAALFLDRAAEAQRLLTQAVAKLPENTAWHHFGRLYLALAEMRG
jgi:tetratricopeptide (TPR) repeat protein